MVTLFKLWSSLSREAQLGVYIVQFEALGEELQPIFMFCGFSSAVFLSFLLLFLHYFFSFAVWYKAILFDFLSFAVVI